MRCCLIVFFASFLVSAAEPQWKMATVIYVHSEWYRDDNVAIENSAMTNRGLHQQLDLDAGHETLTVEQWVFPGQTLRVQEGARVHFAVDGRKVRLRTADGRVRKLSLVRTYNKARR